MTIVTHMKIGGLFKSLLLKKWRYSEALWGFQNGYYYRLGLIQLRKLRVKTA